LHALEHVLDDLIMMSALLGFPLHVLFEVDMSEVQNCTGAYLFLQQVKLYLVYRFQIIA
jgi:hypothetical protein